MMRSIHPAARTIAALLFGFAATGCGGKDSGGALDPEQLAACAGTYSGTYSGPVSGTLAGTLDAEGRFTAMFSGAASASGSGNVREDGSIQFSAGENRVDGSLDVDDCTAGGTWRYGSSASGTWEMSKD
ncbi:MAG TPA: hypothetical protein VIM73_04565 [Polyangiaceae bacterium]